MSVGRMVRPACEDDLECILRLQDAAREAPRWSIEQYRGMLYDSGEEPRRVLLVADVDGVLVGFAAASALLEEAELETVVVSEERRRAGIGRSLLLAVSVWALTQGASELRLEVRESNRVAGVMYQGMGFRQTGLRPRYYSDPQEDALVMARKLP